MTTTSARLRGLDRLWNRQLAHYPDTRPRVVYLGITLFVTIAMYYQLSVQGTVAVQIMRDFGFTFTELVYVGVAGLLVGALASLAAGLADRWGRANLVVGGLLISSLLVTFAVPNTTNRLWYIVIAAAVNLVDGVVLVATPALIRDFSPQLGRAQAMGLWSLGPVLGLIAATEVSNRTLEDHPAWEMQFYMAGAFGFAVWLVALGWLRELSPRLRDQLMVSMKDRALIEARASGVEADDVTSEHWRQMFRFDIVGSSFALGMYLLFYAVAIGYLVLYLATAFGMTPAQANGVANWCWVSMALALVVAGFLSDRIRVRKPLIVLGTLISMVGLGLFAVVATDASTSVTTLKLYLSLIGVGQGVAYTGWMAAFTETVERRNPAATATGLAISGSTLRLMLMAASAVLPLAVPATTALVEHGPRIAEITIAYPEQMKVLQTVAPATLAELEKHPDNVDAQVDALVQLTGKPAAEVRKVVALGSQYPRQLATAAAIDPPVLATLGADPTNAEAGGKAVEQVVKKLNVSPADAMTRLQALAVVPPADLAYIRANGAPVHGAVTRLRSLSDFTAPDLIDLRQYGGEVQQAAADNPKQWQTWWWICFIGMALFLPSVFLLAGRWSPKKAHEDQLAHEQRVEAQLAKLNARELEPS